MVHWRKNFKKIAYGLTFGGIGLFVAVKGIGCAYQKGYIHVVDVNIPSGSGSIDEHHVKRKKEEGELVFKGVINNHELEYREGIPNDNSGEFYNSLIVDIDGEHYELYDLRNATRIREGDFSRDMLEEVVARANRSGVLYKSEAARKSGYGKQVLKAFNEWDKFYNNTRRIILEGADNGTDEELDRVYKAFESFRVEETDD